MTTNPFIKPLLDSISPTLIPCGFFPTSLITPPIDLLSEKNYSTASSPPSGQDSVSGPRQCRQDNPPPHAEGRGLTLFFPSSNQTVPGRVLEMQKR
ncbi:GTP-binding protein SAR1A-like [Pyrus ussuriensis x Pyrus communis]|uniref:GTP-binding protein SAR1A-like n=1 Tax=Pyrus ussuriensis x Pyrus communis TaxID=2448454 RepID=A0A5N5G8L5_9ROSA|nr:GTP-binding protein SAR1A-like [Pyrus ussuriensis x Pyrus communis]